MKVLAGAPCGKTPVYDHFYDCFYGLKLPEGSEIVRARSGSVAQNLNTLVDKAVNENFDYLFIVEDDSAFHPSTVINLLSHNKEVVTGLCLQRHYPFRPYIYQGFDPEAGLLWRELLSTDSGLIKVTMTGMGGILIKTSVFAKLSRPYFYTTFVGEKEWGQDVLFGKALVEAGVEVYCDVDVPIWHATNCSLAAVKENDTWFTVVRIGEVGFKIGPAGK